MKIELHEITVRELVEGYVDDGEGGVVGYGGKLDIRPSYQREFVYKDKERAAVIQTVQKGFPLNVMYWAVRDDGTFEIIDGQQRTISIAQYVNREFSVDLLAFHNLPIDEQAKILDYELMIYLCEGTASERLNWFETINIAGMKLERQELRNAAYAGEWVTDAKRYFSRRGAPAIAVGSDYLKGKPIRQEYLETAIRWISSGKIEEYMSMHQDDHSAVALWNNFVSVLNWVEATFPTKRPKLMKGVNWGELYDAYSLVDLDQAALEAELAQLIDDDEVQNKRGIYDYVLRREERYLNLRQFSVAQKQKAYERQEGICRGCEEAFTIDQMEGDHVNPWSEGGKTVHDNCQMLCRPCNRRKGAR